MSFYFRIFWFLILLAVAGCSSITMQKAPLCDAYANRYLNVNEARAAGLLDAEFGATYCPDYKMHPSWDTDKDGVNDCESEGSCGPHLDYMSVRPG